MKIIATYKTSFGRIEICRSRNGQFYGRVIARNGNELSRTSEVNKRRGSAVKALKATLKILQHADL